MEFLDKILYMLICVYIFVLPLSNEKSKIAGMSVPGDIILAIILVYYLLLVLLLERYRKCFIKSIRDFFTNPLTICLTLLIIVMLFSVCYSYNKKIALTETARFASYICLFFVIKYGISDNKFYKNMINIYLCISAALSIFGIYQFFTGADLQNKFRYKYSYNVDVKVASTLTNPNNFGAYLILCVFPIFMLCVYEKSKRKKIIYIALDLLILINIILTFSRNAFLGIILGIIVLTIIYSRKLLYIFVPGGIIAAFIPQVRIRLLQIGDSTQNESRIKLWKTALKMFKEHLLFGVGNGNYITLYAKYVAKYSDLQYNSYSYSASHNSYLKVMAELGLVGIVLFILTIIIVIIDLYKFIKGFKKNFFGHFYIGFFASLMAFLFMNVSDNLFFVPKTTTYFWLLIAIFSGISYKNNIINQGGKDAK